MAGPTGPTGPSGPHFFSTEGLRQLAGQARKSALNKATDESGNVSDSSALSDAAKGLAITKDEKMLQTMKAELAKLDPESDTFMEEATEKLIDSVIDQEYGESFKNKKGYEGLQEKLVSTILANPETEEAVKEFYNLLLLVEEIEEEQEEFEEEGTEGESKEDQEHDGSEDESYEEE